MARAKAKVVVGPLERQARAALRDSGQAMRRLERAAAGTVAEAADAVISSLRAGGTVYFCGNGGSAADAQHLAAELSGRFFVDRPPMAGVALTTNTSALTAIGNDYGFDAVFSRQLEGVAVPGDVLVAITTSGGSKNVLAAVESAHRLGLVVIGMTGQSGARFAAACDFALVTPSRTTPRIQEGHIAMGHALCELVERAMTPPREANGRARVRKPVGRGRRAVGRTGARAGRVRTSSARPAAGARGR